MRSDHKTTIEVELEGLENKLRTVQLALEILTGACATLPEPVAGETDDSVEGLPGKHKGLLSE
jgi:hypothetical protein